MPRKAYPSPGRSATSPAFLPGKTPRLIEAAEVAKILRRVLRRYFPGQKFYVQWVELKGDLFSRRLLCRALCSGLRRRALKLDGDWRRSGESLGMRPPLDLQTRSER